MDKDEMVICSFCKEQLKFPYSYCELCGWEKSITSESASLTDEELEKLDLESKKVKKLMEQYKEETDRYAIKRGQITEAFKKWLRVEKIYTRAKIKEHYKRHRLSHSQIEMKLRILCEKCEKPQEEANAKVESEKKEVYDYSFKIMMLGDDSVEKTSLTIRYISGFYLEDLKLTIGVDFYSKTTNYRGKEVKLQIWDFGGEERHRFLLSKYFKRTNAALFLYDITNRLTLDHLPDWIQIIREYSGDIPIILVGTNLHLQAKREVSKKEGMLIEKKYNFSVFAEVSAKTGQNVDQLFEDVIEILIERYPERLS
jgi:small GTP-binding protein